MPEDGSFFQCISMGPDVFNTTHIIHCNKILLDDMCFSTSLFSLVIL